MLQLYYRWRYRRTQQADAFQLPLENQGVAATRNRFGSYLSQQAVRGKINSPLDQSRARKRWMARITVLMLLIALAWIVYESFRAIQMWSA